MNICGFEYENYNYDEVIDEEYLAECRNYGEPITKEEIDKQLKEFAKNGSSKGEIFTQLTVSKEVWESNDYSAWLHSLSKEDREIELNNIKMREDMYKTAIEAAPEKSSWEIAMEKYKAEQKEFREKYPYLCKEYHVKGKIVSSLEEV